MKNLKLLMPAIALAAASGLTLAAQQPTTSPAPDTSQPSATLPDVPQPGQSAQPDPADQQTQPAPADPSAQQTQPTQPTMPAQPDPAAQQGSSPTAVVPGATEAAPAMDSAGFQPVNGELVGKIDSKNAKPGDPIVVKTTAEAKFADGVVIPKGSKIIGHVTEVQAHDKTNANSKLTLQFDKAELKGGQTLPIRSVLRSVSPAAGSEGAQASPFAGGTASSGTMGSPASSGSMGGAGQSTPSSSSSANSPMQGAGIAAQPNPGVGSAPAGPVAGKIVAHQGNVDIKTTGIPGVLIAATSSGQPFSNAAGALLGASQNVHLDGGTVISLAIDDANNKASIR